MIEINKKVYTLVEPKAYHFLLLSDWVASLPEGSKFAGQSFTAFYLIYLCLEQNGTELSETLEFKPFIKNLSIEELRGLDAAVKNFQDLLSAPNDDEDDSSGGETDTAD